MATTFGASTASTAAPRRSFKNVSSQVVSFLAGQVTFTLKPGQIRTVLKSAADLSTSLLALLQSGALQELTVFGGKTAVPEPVPPSATPVTPITSFTAATQSSITGSFDGVTIGADGHWLLADGNRLIYPNSRQRQQPAPGSASAITMGATMQRSVIQGSFGFALYTDAGTTDHFFHNGLVVLFEDTGLAQIYQLQNGNWNNIVDDVNGVRNQTPYPLDVNEHTYAVVAKQATSSQLQITVFCDSLMRAQATLGGSFPTNGLVGFATANGSAPISIVPNSFIFQLGVDLRQNLPVEAQEIIQVTPSGAAVVNLAPSGGAAGVVNQPNLDPAVVAGSVTGTGRNLVPDSDFKFSGTLWNTSQAGGLAFVPGAGVSGGKGIVFSAPAGSNTLTGTLRIWSSTMAVSPGDVVSLSGNVTSDALVAGSPGWELWSLHTDGTLNARLTEAAQRAGGVARVSDQNFTIPAGVTSVAAMAATNNCTIMGGGQLIFSEPQLEMGPYTTAYSANVFSDATSTVPMPAMPTPITSTITVNPDGTGALQLGTADPNSPAPIEAMPGQVQSTIATSPNATGSYLQNQTVGTGQVAPSSIANTQASPFTYDTRTANTYNNVANNYDWYLTGSGPVVPVGTGQTVIGDGGTIVYAVSAVDPAPANTMENMMLAANSTITVVFSHPPFVGTSIGSVVVNFAGSQVSQSTALIQSASINGSSSPSITASSSQTTTTPSYTAGLTDTGNPAITSSSQSSTNNQQFTQAESDAETAQITSSSNSSTSNNPFTANVPSTASTPSVASHTNSSTAATAKSGAVNNTSTPTITSSTASSTGNQQFSSSGNDTSNSGITVTNHPAVNNAKTGNASTINSTASITQNSNTTYSNTQETGAANNFSSTATITATANAQTYSTNQHTAAQHAANFNNAYASISGTRSTVAKTQTGTFTTGITTTNAQANTSLTVNSYSHYAGSSTTKNVCSGPIGDQSCTTETIYHLTTYTNTITITGPNGWSWTSAANPTAPFSVTLPYDGQYTVKGSSANATTTTSGDGSSGDALSISWTELDITSSSTDGSWTNFLQTSTSALAPTSTSTQLSLVINSVNAPSDSNGSTRIDILLQRQSDGATMATWNGVSAQTLTYSNASATAGEYIWYYKTTITANNNTGYSSTYAGSLSADCYWYQSDPNPITYTYADANGATSSYATASALAAGSGTPVSLVIASIACPSNSYGATALNVQLLDPNNSVVYNQNITTNQTINYTTSGSPAGVYTWKLQGVLTSDNHTATANQSYAVTCTATPEWYQSVGTTTYTYTTANGATSTVVTSSVALGPSASTAHTLALASISCPSDANGSGSFSITLKDPGGTVLQTWTGIKTNQTLTYSTTDATTGTYTWTLWAVPASNNSGSGTYACSVSATAGWYEQTAAYNTYATTNGASTNYTTAASTVAPTSAAVQLALAMSSVVTPSDANGSSAYSVNLYDPNSVLQKSWTGITAATTLTFSVTGAAAGTWTWTVFATATSSNTATGNVTYNCSCALSLTWYQSVTTNTTTYTSNDGTATNYQTTTATLAPTSAAQQLSLAISAITAGSNAAGASYYSITLKKPDGTQAQQWTGISATQTLTWSNASAPAGQYTWVIYAYCTNTGTATASYSDSLTGSLGWYENVTTTTTTYSSVDGGSTSFTTAASTLAPTSSTTQLSFNISSLVAASDSYGASSWTITLTDPNAAVVKTWTGLTTTQTLTWFGASAVAGTYTWALKAVCTNTGTGTSMYSDTIAGTLQWYQAVTTTTTSYNANPGTPQSFATPSSTVAPTAVATQLTFNITSITVPSDTAGSTSYSVTLTNPSQQVVGSWTVTSATNLSYSNAGATAGVYTWTVQATVTKSGSPAAATYNCSLAATMGWYQAVTTSTTIYNNTASGSVATVSTASATLAPTTSSLQLSLTINSLTLPSDSKGATQYAITLKDPTGAVAQSWSLTAIGQSPLTYYNAAAAAGVYTWTAQATCTNTGTGTETYSTTLNATAGWHQSLTTTTTTCTNHDGSSSSYTTPANTVAPTTAGTQLTLNLSSVITPSNSYGNSSIAVVLYDPNNQIVSAASVSGITAARTITYYNASAISGIYTWVIYGQCTNTGTGASPYSVSWSGTYSWYQPQSATNSVYILAQDGITQRISCSDSNVQFLSITPSQASFQVTNNSNQALSFQLGITAVGF